MDLDVVANAAAVSAITPACRELRPEPEWHARGERWRVSGRYLARGDCKRLPRGVTYGPFPPDSNGTAFPAPTQVRRDFHLMRQAGIDSVRTYCVPPAWFLELAAEEDVSVLADIPWAKHVCFLDSRRARRDAREVVRKAAEIGGQFPSILAYSIGNEIPTDVVRWHGADRVTRFLGTLADAARQADPAALITYANFPPTEYLDLSFVDFATFNVYLHDPQTFRRYLLRLQHLVGDKPLVLGELGMDSLRHGEEAQADFIGGHVREALLAGLAGTFVFSWTDVWHTGGHLVEDWAFGITAADRRPKPAYKTLAAIPNGNTEALLAEHPRVSVVVCSYNGGRTLAQCLESLGSLRYPDYEVILVDDGSTDDTRAIAARFPSVQAIHQENRGLSESRNVGLRAANGSIVAYTDSDCFADPDWLAHLVHQLTVTGANAVGGPNLAPDDGWLAACINASPGQPTHVLESDQVAEHVPGCNMAFRRESLESINGFDPQFLRAGDDVDLCWRLQQAGGWITFAAGAFVWHHRRQTPRTYLRQQAGYGDAEALLRFKHPEKFNGLGGWKWRGVLYGATLRGLQTRESLIYRGTFGTALFQCIYRSPNAYWALVPASLEWHIVAIFAAVNALLWRPAGLLAAGMIFLSVLVAALQSLQSRLPSRYSGVLSRVVIAALSYAQPLVRAGSHYRTRLSSYQAITAHPAEHGVRRHWPRLRRKTVIEYWSEGDDRMALLASTVDELRRSRWGVTLDTGWSEWDAEIFGHPWSCVRATTVQEEHGSGRRLIRVRYHLRPTWLAWAGVAAATVSGTLVAIWRPEWAVAMTICLLVAAIALRLRAAHLASQILEAFDQQSRRLGFIPHHARGAPPGSP